MHFLKEALAGVRRLEDQPEQDTDQEIDLELDNDPNADSLDQEPSMDDELTLSLDDDRQLDPETDQELDGVADAAVEDPNRQGLIRTVKKAHLVYKRETEDGTFEELWMYNVSRLQDELTIKKAILAGTDIPINKTTSPDGSQSYDLWAAGNVEMILIRGLPS